MSKTFAGGVAAIAIIFGAQAFGQDTAIQERSKAGTTAKSKSAEATKALEFAGEIHASQLLYAALATAEASRSTQPGVMRVRECQLVTREIPLGVYVEDRPRNGTLPRRGTPPQERVAFLDEGYNTDAGGLYKNAEIARPRMIDWRPPGGVEVDTSTLLPGEQATADAMAHSQILSQRNQEDGRENLKQLAGCYARYATALQIAVEILPSLVGRDAPIDVGAPTLALDGGAAAVPDVTAARAVSEIALARAITRPDFEARLTQTMARFPTVCRVPDYTIAFKNQNFEIQCGALAIDPLNRQAKLSGGPFVGPSGTLSGDYSFRFASAERIAAAARAETTVTTSTKATKGAPVQ